MSSQALHGHVSGGRTRCHGYRRNTLRVNCQNAA
jgi:hypothetical protein